MLSLKSIKKQKLLKTLQNKPLKTSQKKLLKTPRNKLLNKKDTTVCITLPDCKKPISKKRNTFFNSLVILPLIVFSNLALSQTLAEQDSSKPTVCTVTINSTDEKEVFQNYLEDDFNFVELTALGEEYTSEEDWFLGACKSGVQCDILVISGHFGGSFFGSSDYRLSLSELQRRSCQERCSGILKKPKEVFLFGCNTTAGKKADHRSPEEYTRVLIEDGFSRRQAEQVSAFRYSPIGEQTQDRMKQVFPFSRIYGFHSLAPSGKNIRPRLNKYFKSIPNKDYISHLSNFPKKEENHFWSRAMKGQFIRSVDGVEDIENPMCVLEKPEPLYKKLLWIKEVLSDNERSLSYIPIIDLYFKDLERMFGEDWEDFPGEEQSILEQIQFNSQGKNTVNELLSQAIPGVLSAQITVLNFGKRIGWYDKEVYNEKLKLLIGDMFKENLDWEQRDLICSLGVEIDLRLEDLPEERWNRATVSALGCVKPSDTRIHKELLRILQDKSEGIYPQLYASWALINQNSLSSDDVISALIAFLQDKSEHIDLRSNVAWALVKQNSLNSDVISALITILKDNSEKIKLRITLTKALVKQNSLNSDMISTLIAILQDKSEHMDIRFNVLMALVKQISLSSDVISILIAILQDKSEVSLLRFNVASALVKQNSLSSDVISILIAILQDKSEHINHRSNVAWALGEQNSLSSDVISALIAFLQDKSVPIHYQRHITSTLIRYFKYPLNISQAMVTIDELKQIASSNPEGAKHILKAISEEASLDEEIRRKATQTLQSILTNPILE